MPYCQICGAEVTGRFCAKCGAAVGGGEAPGPAPTTAGAGAGLPDNIAAALSYVFVLGILFLLIDPYRTRQEVRFHAFQAIYLTVAIVVFWIAFDIVSAILGHFAALLAVFMGLVGTLIAIAFLVLWIYAIYQAFQGRRFKLPVVGHLAEKQS